MLRKDSVIMNIAVSAWRINSNLRLRAYDYKLESLRLWISWQMSIIQEGRLWNKQRPAAVESSLNAFVLCNGLFQNI